MYHATTHVHVHVHVRVRVRVRVHVHVHVHVRVRVHVHVRVDMPLERGLRIQPTGPPPSLSHSASPRSGGCHRSAATLSVRLSAVAPCS